MMCDKDDNWGEEKEYGNPRQEKLVFSRKK